MKYTKIAFIIMLLGLFSCAGEPGKDGSNGIDSTGDSVSGYNSLITITDEEAGENCEAGGKRIDTGLDDGDGTGIAKDGILQESEVDYSEYVCNGLNGTDGNSGENGDDGTDGTNGDDGTDGENGSSGTDGTDGDDGTSGSDGLNGDDGQDSTADIDDATGDNYIKLSSIAEKGPCGKGSAVLAFPLNSDFSQTGSHYLGSTKTDLGYWEVPAQISENRTQVDFEGLCYNERYGTTETQKLNAIVITDSPDRNINPLTTISVDVIRWVYENQAVEDEDQAVIDAEFLVSNVFGFGQMAPFSSITLNDGDLDAAKLAIASAAILQARSNQTDFMTEISEAIKNENTDAVETELASNIEVMPIYTVVKNMRSKYDELGHVWIYPPMHTVAGFADYYDDLLTRVPVEQGSLNSANTSGCSMDLPYKRYAIPVVFESWIETSNYIASNLGGNVSIQTRGTHVDGYDAPGTEIMDVEQLREKLLDSTLQHHGMIENHSLLSGDEVYFVAEKETGWILSKGCNADLLPFGRVLASHDGGVTYIGHDNNSLFFRRGISITGFD